MPDGKSTAVPTREQVAAARRRWRDLGRRRRRGVHALARRGQPDPDAAVSADARLWAWSVLHPGEALAFQERPGVRAFLVLVVVGPLTRAAALPFGLDRTARQDLGLGLQLTVGLLALAAVLRLRVLARRVASTGAGFPEPADDDPYSPEEVRDARERRRRQSLSVDRQVHALARRGEEHPDPKVARTQRIWAWDLIHGRGDTWLARRPRWQQTALLTGYLALATAGVVAAFAEAGAGLGTALVVFATFSAITAVTLAVAWRQRGTATRLLASTST